MCKWVVEMWRDEFPVDVQDDRNSEQLSRRGWEVGTVERLEEEQAKDINYERTGDEHPSGRGNIPPKPFRHVERVAGGCGCVVYAKIS